MSKKETEVQGLHNLVAPWGARKGKKRLGRGRASGHGKTAGRGHKGQKKTKSGNVRPGFEGGQLPMARRLPKRGFKNFAFKTVYTVVNLGRIAERLGDAKTGTVDLAWLLETGLVNKTDAKVKVLGTGEIAAKITLKAHAVSASAKAKVEAKGGQVEVLDAPKASA
jgi:large subunit ribosomal protein L15